MQKFTLNVQSGSHYAKFNGLIFDLVEKCGERVTLDVFGTKTDFTTKEATEIRQFLCDVCKCEKIHVSNLTTGYATNDKNEKICFDCCGKEDEANLLSLPIGGKYVLYLVKRENGWFVTNWPGTFSREVFPLKGRHNIARTRYDVWFQVGKNHFHGVQYGECTQICHVRRIKA